MAKRDFLTIIPPKGKLRHAIYAHPESEDEVIAFGRSKTLCGKRCSGWKLEAVQETFNKDCVKCMTIKAKGS